MKHWFQMALAATPGVLSMYTLYYLEHGEVWTIDTPHRAKITISILLLGMGLSFLLMSRVAARQTK